MGLYPIPTNAPPMNTDSGQLIGLLTGQVDAGPLTLLGPIAAPTTALTAAINTTSGNLNGSYGYVVAFGSGSMAANGTYSLTGWTLPGPVSNTIAPADEQGNLSAIPIGPTGTIVRGLYRNLASGSPTTGPFYLVTILTDNTTTTFVDNVADASLGAAAPSANTTGTSLRGAFGPSTFANPTWTGTATNSGTISGGVVNPASGTVTGTWKANQVRLPGCASASLPSLYWNSFATAFTPGSAIGLSLVNISGFSGLALTAANLGVYAAAASMPGVILKGTGAVTLASRSPSTTAGEVTQQNNALFLGNGSTAQPIPTGGEYEIATLLLPNGTSGYNITTTTISDASGVGANVLINTLPANGTVALEASFTAGSNAETTNVALWDVTAGSVVSGSTIATTSASVVVLRSGSLSLVAGHQYQAIAYYTTAGTGNTGYIYSARLIASF